MENDVLTGEVVQVAFSEVFSSDSSSVDSSAVLSEYPNAFTEAVSSSSAASVAEAVSSDSTSEVVLQESSIDYSEPFSVAIFGLGGIIGILFVVVIFLRKLV